MTFPCFHCEGRGAILTEIDPPDGWRGQRPDTAYSSKPCIDCDETGQQLCHHCEDKAATIEVARDDDESLFFCGDKCRESAVAA